MNKTNYLLQADAIKTHIIPQKDYAKEKEWLLYAEEADLLNVALFNCTAKDWREANTELTQKSMNLRDIASINELAILSNLESLNAQLIKENIDKPQRFIKLKQMAKYQMNTFNKQDQLKPTKRLSDQSYLNVEN